MRFVSSVASPPTLTGLLGGGVSGLGWVRVKGNSKTNAEYESDLHPVLYHYAQSFSVHIIPQSGMGETNWHSDRRKLQGNLE